MTFIEVDIASEDSVQVVSLKERHQRIDGVFWSRIMGVNVKGTFLTLKHTLPIMERQGKGVIVITTSVAAGPVPGRAPGCPLCSSFPDER